MIVKTLFTTAFLLLSSSLFSQTFSYSFEGALTQEERKEIQQRILKLSDIRSCELKYKEDSQRGELIFYHENNEERAEEDQDFSPVYVKSILIEFDLQPIDFRQIK